MHMHIFSLLSGMSELVGGIIIIYEGISFGIPYYILKLQASEVIWTK